MKNAFRRSAVSAGTLDASFASYGTEAASIHSFSRSWHPAPPQSLKNTPAHAHSGRTHEYIGRGPSSGSTNARDATSRQP